MFKYISRSRFPAVGIMGSDQYRELPGYQQEVLTFSDIAYQGLSLVFAARWDKAKEIEEKLLSGEELEVATSYKQAADRCLRDIGNPNCKIVELDGGIELAPGIDMLNVDAIFDLVDTGYTLERHNLRTVGGYEIRVPVSLGAVWSNQDA
jgi:ATP phosphoribosyltransferase